MSERCRLGYLAQPGLCNSLSAKFSTAQSSLARGNWTAVRGQLGSFKGELSVQRGKGVDETIYWLLSALADVVVAGLPGH